MWELGQRLYHCCSAKARYRDGNKMKGANTMLERFIVEVRLDPKGGSDRVAVKKAVLEAARVLAVNGCQAAVYNEEPPDAGELFFARFPN